LCESESKSNLIVRVAKDHLDGKTGTGLAPGDPEGRPIDGFQPPEEETDVFIANNAGKAVCDKSCRQLQKRVV
jgi:hypothetical protein